MMKKNKYWFKIDFLGLSGWGPISWEGWLTIAIFFLVFVAGLNLLFLKNPQDNSSLFAVFLLVLIISFVSIVFIKGKRTNHKQKMKEIKENWYKDKTGL